MKSSLRHRNYILSIKIPQKDKREKNAQTLFSHLVPPKNLSLKYWFSVLRLPPPSSLVNGFKELSINFL